VAAKIRSVEKSINSIGNRKCYLPACSIVPLRTTLPLAEKKVKVIIVVMGLSRDGSVAVVCFTLMPP
jgi:hypothetical protein